MTMNTTTASSPITKPMLADKCERLHALSFPLLATPKLDGIRCLKLNGRALTRSFKPVSNRFIREWIEANLPDGLDGELIVKGTTFNETAGHVGRESGEPDFTFAVFDYVSDGIDVPYACRMQELARLPDYLRVDKVLPEEIHSLDDLMVYEERCVSEGYEGVMIRTPGSPYKCGRSTEREGYLLKIKRFEDAEAVVLDTYEGMSNQNAAEKDAFGRTKRSMAQSGMVGRGELGGFVVRHVETGIEFRLGYNHVVGGVDRVSLWQQRSSLLGRMVKFMHQPSGAKEAPRFPKFIGFREQWDLS
jgi:DNA ligase-1